jgi:general secretion pathway protein N
MHARSSGWLLLTLVVLAVLLAAELHFEVGAGSARQSIRTGSAPAAASPAPLFTLADRVSFSETLTRPLFSPNREPPGTESASALPAPQAPRPSANRYALSAIIIVDNERIALLMDTATGSLSRVREGDSLAGWRVEEIRADGAVLHNGDVREELSLRTFGAPAPVPVPRPPKRRAGAAAGPPAGYEPEALPKRPRRPKRGPRQGLPIPRASSN